MRARSLRTIEVALCACLTACSGARPAVAPVPAPRTEPPAAPVHRDLSESEIEAIAGLLRMEDERRLDSGRIAGLLGHESAEVRRRAVLAAGRIRDLAAQPILLRALDDADPVVVESAVFALGELGDTAGTVILALAGVIDDAANRTARIRAEAIAALGQLASPAARAAVEGLLSRYPADTRARPPADAVAGEALLALWRFERPARSVDLVLPFVTHDDPEIRWRATYALMRMSAPAAAPALLDRAEDATPLVRALAVRAFRRGFADSADARDRARPALVRALTDADPHVRIQAINALASWAEPAITPPVLTRLDDEDGNVRVAAALAAASLPGRDVALRLRATVEDPRASTGLRAAALTSLGRVDPEAAAIEAARWAASGDWLHRLLAVRGLSAVAWEHASPVLTGLASDPDARVARAALAAVSRSADSSLTAYALYVETLKSPDPEVRAAAIGGLGRRANPADLAALMDAYDAAQHDTMPAAALAAVDALAALSRAGVPAERAFFLRFAPHADPLVRRRVVQRLGGGNEPAWADTVQSSPSPRTDRFYEEVVRRYIAPHFAGMPPPRLEIGTEHGIIGIDLMAAEAPLTVHNMVSLVESGFYASADPLARRWHRVVPDFVLQDGDPRGDGSGGPRHRIRDEINSARYLRGTVGMALSGPDTGGSQFFIAHSPQPHLDGGYTVFGHVVTGLDVADAVVQEDRILFMRIVWP